MARDRDTRTTVTLVTVCGRSESSCTRRANQEEWYTHLLKLLEKKELGLFFILFFLHQNRHPRFCFERLVCILWMDRMYNRMIVCFCFDSCFFSIREVVFFLMAKSGRQSGRSQRDRRKKVNAMRRRRRRLFETNVMTATKNKWSMCRRYLD